MATFSFSNVVQVCTTKTRIIKKTMTTNITTTCTVALDLVAQNTGVTNTPAFSVLLWVEQGSSFNPEAGASSISEKVKALRENASRAVKVRVKFNVSQAGSFIFATDTNRNVVASVEVPAPE